MLGPRAAALLMLSGAAFGQVALRGGERISEPASAVSVEGVRVGPRLIPWDRVRVVEGELAGEAEAWLDIAEKLWRARARLERGDAAMAEPLFEEVFESLRGSPGPTALAAAEGLLRCRLARGARAAAVEPWLEVKRLRREGALVEFRGPPVIDAEWGLAPALPPVWGQDAGAEALGREAGGRSADFVVAALDDLYRWSALRAAGVDGTSATAPIVGEEEGGDPAVALVQAMVEAQHGEGMTRERARERLAAGLSRDLGTWREAWRRAAIGLSLTSSPEPAARRAGLLELLQIPARFSGSQPDLAGLALREAARVLEMDGDTEGAAALRNEATGLRASAVGVWGGSTTAAEAGGALERYLEANGLQALLVEQLERRLAMSPPAERLALAERLSALYADLLTMAADAEARASLEQRARNLLDAVPEADSADLRLNLHRATYLRAEEIAERWRLRLATPAEVEQAERSLRALGPDLARIGAVAHRRVEALEKQEELGRDTEQDVLMEALAAARRQRSLAMYLGGWANVYLAEITDSGPTAVEALRLLGWLLNASDGSAPTLERVPTQTLQYEHIARAALGAATAESVRGADDAAKGWLDLVEATEGVPPAVREQVFARRAAALARAGAWSDLVRLVSLRRGESVDGARRRTVESPLSPNEARLIAVLAFEEAAAKREESAARSLRATAMGDLVAKEQLTQVVDLARRYGTEPLGEGGFIVDYVRGLLAYQRARDAHGADGADAETPTGVAETIGLYETAEALLAAAAVEADASKFPQALADAQMLRGLAMFWASGSSNGAVAQDRALGAAAQLLGVVDNGGDSRLKADAMWMASRALEWAEAAKGARSKEALERREALIAEFVATFPADERAGRLLIQQSASGALEPEEAVSRLLATPEGSPMRAAAQREAARLLFGMTREGEPASRRIAAVRFVETSLPVLEIDRVSAVKRGDVEAADRAALMARQILEASLSLPTPDVRAAGLALDALESMRDARVVDLSPYEDELLFRRLQAMVGLGDVVEAERVSDELYERAQAGGGPFARAGLGMMLQRAATEWRADGSSAERARAMVKQGVRALAVDWAGLNDAARLTVRVYVGEAAAWLWEQEDDERALELAIEMHRAALERQPNDGALLKRMATLSEAAGDRAKALEAWVRLLAGADVASGAWFEAKTHVIELTAADRPDAARELLEEHRALYPNYGPSPWGDRLREVEAALGAGAPEPEGGMP